MNIQAKRKIKFSVLDEEKISKIHEASLYLIEEVGMKISGERTLKLLQENGAKTDSNGITRIPRGLVEKSLRTVPKEIVLYTRDGQPHIIINSENQVYFGTHADQLEYVDPLTGKVRRFLKKDTETMCKLADYLPNIDFILSVGMSGDVRPEVQSQITFLETVKNFRKPINFSTNDIESLQDIIDIASVVAGGLDKLQEKPFVFNYCEPIPPLTHPVESTEKLYISALNRIPVVYMPYSMMGGTSPMSFAAALAQNNAEILTGLVITQLVNEGTPFIYGSMPTILDMRTTIGSYGAPEFHLLVAAASEISRHYGIPFYGTAGCTDAKVIDEQAISETTMEIFSSLLSMANIVHDVGVMDHCKSVSPELVVLADEIIECLKHYSQGIEVNEEELVFEVIESVGHGGHYLQEEHTLMNFRKAWYPNIFSRKMQNPDESEIKGLVKEKIRSIVENHEVPKLSAEVLSELDKWYAKFEL
jgi:trimethylamine---corrinoid protein Co-methyltransferase